MAGFETVVRPVVFPNIRPTPQRSIAQPSDDPTQGQCVIRGTGARLIDLTYSWSVSSTQSRPVETQRRVDVTRVYQENDDGSVNRNNFVELEVPNRLIIRDPIGGGGG